MLFITRNDFVFNIENIVRFITLLKVQYLKSAFTIPEIVKLNLFFVLKKVKELRKFENLNFFYFFYYFLGRVAYICRWKKHFILGHTYFDYKIQVDLIGKDIYFFLSFLIYDVMPILSLEYLIFYFYKPYFFLSILDGSLFSELKLNNALYDLRTPLNSLWIFRNNNYLDNYILLFNLKLGI